MLIRASLLNFFAKLDSEMLTKKFIGLKKY